MGRADIHGCGNNPYGFTLALYKIKFEEIWYHEIANMLSLRHKIFDDDNMVTIRINPTNYRSAKSMICYRCGVLSSQLDIEQKAAFRQKLPAEGSDAYESMQLTSFSSLLSTPAAA
jgi:succinyl-CoA synthetase beta subunit